MTVEERADFLRREAIRAARFEGFVARQLAIQREIEARARELCERRIAERKRQLVLDFAI